MFTDFLKRSSELSEGTEITFRLSSLTGGALELTGLNLQNTLNVLQDLRSSLVIEALGLASNSVGRTEYIELSMDNLLFVEYMTVGVDNTIVTVKLRVTPTRYPESQRIITVPVTDVSSQGIVATPAFKAAIITALSYAPL